ncbi:MAG: Tfp pilus assembly protein FimT/FimU [Candidatus Saccharimonadia bacterium]
MTSWSQFKNINSRGFTLVEVSITLAIMMLITGFVVAGATTNIRTQRFSEQVKTFANLFSSSQTTSYANKLTTNGISCPLAGQSPINSSSSSDITTAVGPDVCFWRGNVLDFTLNGGTNNPYTMSLLYGSDISQASANLSQQDGILGQLAPLNSYNTNSNGLDLTINYDSANPSCGSSNSPVWVPTSSLSVAFLAPDGSAWTATPGNYAYVNRYPLQFILTDSGVAGLTGTVTVTPCTGSIIQVVK